MKHMLNRGIAASVLLISILLLASPAKAELADLADVPLTSSASSAVRPNLIYILDDSSSMTLDYMPSNVAEANSCKSCITYTPWSCTLATNYCADRTDPIFYNAMNTGTEPPYPQPPYFSSEFNKVYYNPDITYAPPVKADGTSWPNIDPTNAPNDAFFRYFPAAPLPTLPGGILDGKINIANVFPNVQWCNTSTWPPPFPTANCRRNGIDNVNKGFDYFLYNSGNITDTSKPLGGYPLSSGTAGGTAGAYAYPQTGASARYGNPYYYTISPNEYCSDSNLINCAPAKADGSAPTGYSIPAIVRYCRSQALVVETTPASDPPNTAVPSCRRAFSNPGYIYPRFGRFRRVDIKPGNNNPKRASAQRPDCANATYCTYNEEIQNFANWYSYYRTRLNLMKTATGRAFSSIDDRYRVGFTTINPILGGDTQVSAKKWLPLATFDIAQKTKFYDWLYVQADNGGTPLRQSLARVGRHYAGITNGINLGMPQDPIQYSCQQNFALLTSDGYWNEADSTVIKPDNSQIGNQDNVPNTSAPVFVSRATGTLDGMGTVTTNTTPTTIVEQTLCTGNANTAFTSGTQTPCGCPTTPAGLKRIKQRTIVQSSVATLNDDVPLSTSVSPGVVTFQDITPICTTLVSGADISLNPNPTVTAGTVSTVNVPGGTANTLADVAMYYYKTDLRTSGPLATNNVPTNAKDITPQQHMVTYTLGLGVTGLMNYIPDYETNLTGDFAKIKNGSSGCPWTTGTCNWPKPTSNANTTLDDLWHAAVNGRGTYYNASDPNSLAESLSSALTGIKTKTAAASASATSTPNVTPADNFIYSSTFRTPQWDGEITAQKIDPVTGKVLSGSAWTSGSAPTGAQALLDAKVAATADTRTIFTFSPTTGSKLRTFTWANLSGSEQAGFANKCGALSQCNLLSTIEQGIANSGENLVNYLRGQTQYGVGTNSVFRSREHALGDSVNASPVFIRVPKYNFNDATTPTYASFKSANAARQAMLYVAANDGMLHAFSGDTGQELWAYVPRMVLPLLPGLASESWGINHRFVVDGTPTIMDVFDASASAWKTILVAGLGKGGRGYYALDITNPGSPKGLWEACSDSSLCDISDDDFGFTYGSPIITKLPTNGRWVALVTSGMNNVSPGTGRGVVFALDALTGDLVKKIDTGAGDTSTPSGLAKISGYANNYILDNTIQYIYGGDLLGNLWSINMTTATPTVLKLAALTDATGKPQSITTRPEVSVVSGTRVVYVGTGRLLGAGDVADPATLSPPLPWAYQQSLYAIKDRGVALGNIRTSTPGLVKQSLTTTSLTTRSTSTNAVDWDNKDGWYVDFNPANASPGERVHLDPILIQGALVVATAVPTSSGSGACSASGGDSWFYQFDYKSGQFIASASGAVVGEKFTGALIVGISIILRSDGTPEALVKLNSGDIPEKAIATPSPKGAGKRTSWRELIQ